MKTFPSNGLNERRMIQTKAKQLKLRAWKTMMKFERKLSLKSNAQLALKYARSTQSRTKTKTVKLHAHWEPPETRPSSKLALDVSEIAIAQKADGLTMCPREIRNVHPEG